MGDEALLDTDKSVPMCIDATMEAVRRLARATDLSDCCAVIHRRGMIDALISTRAIAAGEFVSVFLPEGLGYSNVLLRRLKGEDVHERRDAPLPAIETLNRFIDRSPPVPTCGHVVHNDVRLGDGLCYWGTAACARKECLRRAPPHMMAQGITESPDGNCIFLVDPITLFVYARTVCPVSSGSLLTAKSFS